MLALVAIIVAVVVVKRTAANKQTGSMKANPEVVELEEKDAGAEYDDTVINKENDSVGDSFGSYENVDSKTQNKNAKTHLRRRLPLKPVRPM